MGLEMLRKNSVQRRSLQKHQDLYFMIIESSAVQYRAEQCSAVQYRAVQCCTVLCSNDKKKEKSSSSGEMKIKENKSKY